MSPSTRRALAVFCALVWASSGMLKLVVPDAVAFRQFFGHVLPVDAKALAVAYRATAVAEVLLALFLIVRQGASGSGRASFGLASLLLFLQAAWGVDSDCGCFGTVAVSWPVRVAALGVLVVVSHASTQRVKNSSAPGPRECARSASSPEG